MTIQLGPARTELQGKRVKAARIWAELSQGKLAAEVSEMIGDLISRNIISKIENGERAVTEQELTAISIITGQPYEWLRGAEDVAPVFDLNRGTGVYRRSFSRLAGDPDLAELARSLRDHPAAVAESAESTAA